MFEYKFLKVILHNHKTKQNENDGIKMTGCYQCECCNFKCVNLKRLLNHLYSIHSRDLNFKVKCGVLGCNLQFTKYNSLYKHVVKQHAHIYNHEHDNGHGDNPGQKEHETELLNAGENTCEILFNDEVESEGEGERDYVDDDCIDDDKIDEDSDVSDCSFENGEVIFTSLFIWTIIIYNTNAVIFVSFQIFSMINNV